MSESDAEEAVQPVRSTVMFKPDTDKAFTELLLLQKALLDTSSEEFEDYSMATSQTNDLLGMEDSMFSSTFDQLTLDQNNGKQTGHSLFLSVEY